MLGSERRNTHLRKGAFRENTGRIRPVSRTNRTKTIQPPGSSRACHIHQETSLSASTITNNDEFAANFSHLERTRQQHVSKRILCVIKYSRQVNKSSRSCLSTIERANVDNKYRKLGDPTVVYVCLVSWVFQPTSTPRKQALLLFLGGGFRNSIKAGQNQKWRMDWLMRLIWLCRQETADVSCYSKRCALGNNTRQSNDDQ